MLEVFKTDCLRVIKKKLDYRRSLKAVKKPHHSNEQRGWKTWFSPDELSQSNAQKR